MRWFRVHASSAARVALLALAFAGVSAARPHADDCHEACHAVEHDASAHRVTAAVDASEHPLHCLVCHWVRSFRPGAESRVLIAPASQTGISTHVEYVTAAFSAPVAQPPLRSPPSSPHFV